MSIIKFRQRYPEYKYIPDFVLVDKLYKKYYSDQDFETFKKQFLGPKAPTEMPTSQAVDSKGPPTKSAPSKSIPNTLIDFIGNRIQDQRNLIHGVISGVKNAGEGVLHTGSSLLEKVGVLDPGTTQQYAKTIDQNREAFSQSAAGKSFLGKSGRFVGEMLPWFLIPGGNLIRGARGGKALITSAASGGLLGGAIGGLQYQPKNPKDLEAAEGVDGVLNQKAQQTKQGAIIGAGAGLLFGLPGIIANRVNQAFVKRMSQSPETHSAIQQGVKHKVPVLTSDVSTPFINRTGELLEYAPVGMIKKRLIQNKAAKKAAKHLTDHYDNVLSSKNFGGLTGLKTLEKAAAGKGQYAETAKRLLQNIKNPHDDWNEIIQLSGQVKLARSKIIAKKKYSSVSHEADKFGAFSLSEKSGSLQAIKAGIKSATDRPLEKTDIIAQLKKIESWVKDPKRDYSSMNKAREALGDMIDSYFQGPNAALGKQGSEILQSVKSAIQKDLDKFASSKSHKLHALDKHAKHFYEKNIASARTHEIAKMLKTSKPDEIYKQFVRNSLREDGKGRGAAMQLYRALDEKGRAAVRYGMVSEAFNVASTRIKNQQGIALSPAKFANSLEKISAAKGVFFKGAEKQEIDGFINLMRVVQRSGQIAENPPTGHRLLAVLAGMVTTGGVMSAGQIGNPAMVPAVGGALLVLKKLLTTDAGRRLLKAASHVSPGTTAAEKMLERIHQLLRNTLIIEGTA